MSPSLLDFLEHILHECNYVLRVQEGRTISELLDDETFSKAIVRSLEIIGEAISRLLKLNETISLSYARIIVDLRNRIIHAYDNVNDAVIWKIIMKDIPMLQQEVQQLLGEG